MSRLGIQLRSSMNYGAPSTRVWPHSSEIKACLQILKKKWSLTLCNILSYSDRQELCQVLSFKVIPFLLNHEWSKYGNKILTILSLRSSGPNESKVYCIGGPEEILSPNWSSLYEGCGDERATWSLLQYHYTSGDRELHFHYCTWMLTQSIKSRQYMKWSVHRVMRHTKLS